MKIRILILNLTLFCQASTNFSVLKEEELLNYQVVDLEIKSNSSDAIIKFIKDKDNNLHIIKQIKDESLEEQFLLLNDFIACQIGYHINININKVFLIPRNILSSFKIFPNRAATLHLCVPGKNIEPLPDFLPSWFTIHQKSNSIWQKAYHLKPEHQGLTQEIIESMSLHNDLPPIVALDTFVGNADRSEPNLFYCNKSKCFYAIDLAAAFNTNLAEIAIIRISELIKNNYFKKCKPQILNTLKVYRDTLDKLYCNYSDNKIIKYFQDYYSLIFTESNYIEIKNRFEFQKNIITKNYIATKKLIDIIDQII